MFYALEQGHSFSVEEKYVDDSGEVRTRKREAFAEELTEAQLKFIFHGKEQRKKMRQENSGMNKPGMNF
ncbi:hypothetical protein M199_gp020 [Halogranum tailed virus 1]|uniref:Uncharacterized protein n=1 Tax=Halogranum tailed virus 1 TaxID=1273749 RepID=R4T8X4_9CAUD|nr:hypothetical protein M199_gp020 [Halogranum tailed virus 1]AGM11350.1 hypothetical protein HGTV1_20 [Halogranum tailed virus 1]